MRTAREQHVGRALGEDAKAPVAIGVGVHRAHQLAVRGEWHLAHALEARVERRVLEPGLARGDDERALRGVALHRPAAVALLQHRIIRAVAYGERTPAPAARLRPGR